MSENSGKNLQLMDKFAKVAIHPASLILGSILVANSLMAGAIYSGHDNGFLNGFSEGLQDAVQMVSDTAWDVTETNYSTPENTQIEISRIISGIHGKKHTTTLTIDQDGIASSGSVRKDGSDGNVIGGQNGSIGSIFSLNSDKEDTDKVVKGFVQAANKAMGTNIEVKGYKTGVFKNEVRDIQDVEVSSKWFHDNTASSREGMAVSRFLRETADLTKAKINLTDNTITVKTAKL